MAWLGFGTFLVGMLALDLGVFHRKSHIVGFREAMMWTFVWVALDSGMGRGTVGLGWTGIAGLVLWGVGIGGESVADAQLSRFRGNPGNRGQVCQDGLWRWSRHPNYFFEWLHWFCYPLLAIGGDWGWVALIGPAFMYWLLAHVSGVPPLEAQMLKSRGEAYAAYQQRVRAFFPFPKGVRP